MDGTMNINPILNPSAIGERIPLPIGAGITVPAGRRRRNDILSIATQTPDPTSTEVTDGDMFLNPNTGYCVEYRGSKYAPITPGVAQALSEWMEANHPRLHALINWDENPHWTDT